MVESHPYGDAFPEVQEYFITFPEGENVNRCPFMTLRFVRMIQIKVFEPFPRKKDELEQGIQKVYKIYTILLLPLLRILYIQVGMEEALWYTCTWTLIELKVGSWLEMVL